MAKYTGDLLLAGTEMKAMKRFADEDGVPWTLTHALLANMGGFVIRTHESKRAWRTTRLATTTKPNESVDKATTVNDTSEFEAR